MAFIRAALTPLEHKAHALGVLHRPLVESIDLELETVETKVVEEMALEETCPLVGHPPTAEVRMDGEPAQVGDPVPTAAAREAHRPRQVAVDLDHEQAVDVRLGLVPLDVGRQRVTVVRPARGEKRLHILVRDEVDEEVEVVGPSAADRDHYAGSSLGAARRRTVNRSPEPRAIPTRISPSPSNIGFVIGSERKSAPYAIAKPGIR